MIKSIAILGAFLVVFSSRGQTPPSQNTVIDSVAVPENLGLGLRQLTALDQQDSNQSRAAISSSKSIISDASGRVTVNIYLDGSTTLEALSAKLVDLGLEVIAVETHWRHGVISARLPISQATTVAQLPGVRSVMLAHKPMKHVGVVTAESSVVERARDVNTPGIVTAQGLLGRNISIGIVSDSYDQASGVPRASVGVAAGDLPGPGNPDGYTQPVVVLFDDSTAGATDEGRGMAEIVHDMAPAAKICFSAAGQTQAAFANSIRNLRTSSQTRCDILVDDIAFPDEPFFSDGIVAQAVEAVVNDSTMAGKNVSYFSASGNSVGGYSADVKLITPSTGLAHKGNLNFNQVPSSLYAGGFHNLGTDPSPQIAMTVTTGSASSHEISFQWDGLFDVPGGTTDDYNLLVFSSAGAYLGNLSGTDNNPATEEPVEIVDLAANTTYQLVICLRTTSSPAATHLRFITSDGDTTGPLISNNTITIFGHPTAADANAIAAYSYSNTPSTVVNYNSNQLNPPPGPYQPLLETFNAVGGNIPIYFDGGGQRLSSPQIRIKPDFAACDGVDTSFFPADPGSDYDNDGFPNFFGTSAAAPNAAAIAALLLEAAGGPSSLTPAQVRTYLQQSTWAHDIDPNFSQATASSGTASVHLTASGDDSNASSASPTFFTATFIGQAGETLNQLTIDLTNASLVFDGSATLGFPFTVGSNTGNVSVSSSLSPDNRTLTLSFGNTFTPGKSISFGIDRDFAGISADGNSADYLGGVSITAVTGAGQTFYGAFANQLGSSFTPFEGHGLLDAKLAVQKIVGTNSAGAGYPANLSTRGVVGTGDNVLIGGTIISGPAAKKVIIRAIGPSLGIPGELADPTLELYNANGQKFASDDNWQDDPDQAAQIQASTIPPKDPLESALVETLNPGAYTAIVRGANNSTGIGLVEIYNLDSPPPVSLLANIATRGNVQNDDNILIAGFILSHGPSQVVVRAAGPSLSGVSGTLADPSLELHDGQGNILASNDNWQQDSFQAMQIQTFGLAPTSALESAVISALNPGAYTIVVRGAHNTTGVATVEVYHVQ